MKRIIVFDHGVTWMIVNENACWRCRSSRKSGASVPNVARSCAIAHLQRIRVIIAQCNVMARMLHDYECYDCADDLVRAVHMLCAPWPHRFYLVRIVHTAQPWDEVVDISVDENVHEIVENVARAGRHKRRRSAEAESRHVRARRLSRADSPRDEEMSADVPVIREEHQDEDEPMVDLAPPAERDDESRDVQEATETTETTLVHNLEDFGMFITYS